MASFKNSCNCGGYAWTMNGRPREQPHMTWCPQYTEYAEGIAAYTKRWEEYLATYPGDLPIKNLESDLSHITAEKLKGNFTYRNNLYDAVAQMISKKLEELKQERGEPK